MSELQDFLIDMIPTPGGQRGDSGTIIRRLLKEFLAGFPLRALLFLLDMVLPQLDAYHSGRRMQPGSPMMNRMEGGGDTGVAERRCCR
jgi:hypothetical protein